LTCAVTAVALPPRGDDVASVILLIGDATAGR
jgi:hypothetical protein